MMHIFKGAFPFLLFDGTLGCDFILHSLKRTLVVLFSSVFGSHKEICKRNPLYKSICIGISVF